MCNIYIHINTIINQAESPVTFRFSYHLWGKQNINLSLLNITYEERILIYVDKNSEI